jgi:tetratricopeptide (TPR) repeat protein
MLQGLWIGCWVFGGIVSDARADPANEESEETPVSESVMGKQLPPLVLSPELLESYEAPRDISFEEYKDRPYPNSTYLGAEMLQMEPAFVHAIQEGLEKVYLRDYKGARKHFRQVEETYPHSAVAAVADTLVWQAIMLENFDFSLEDRYWNSTKRASEQLDEALKDSKNQAWEHFLSAGIDGIEAIHTLRNGKYIPALQLAFSAMGHIEKSREQAPTFIDLKLADGMYHYWRTVVTMSSSFLPDFGDHRPQGIAEMKEVELQGIFLRAPATLSMAFVWHEEGKLRDALSSCLRNRKAYPNNIINNLVTGSTYTFLKKYASALGVYEEILEDDPTNRRVHYWRGLTYQRSAQYDLSRQAYQRYLAFETLEETHRGHTHYRLGQVAMRQKDYPAAVTSYQSAVKVNGHKQAKRSLERLKEQKKRGHIDY